MDLKRLMNTFTGRVMISIILGLGLATIFRKICKDGHCLEFVGLPAEDISAGIYQHDGKCYKYTQQSTVCKAEEKKVVPIHRPPENFVGGSHTRILAPQ